MGPGDLSEVLSKLPRVREPRLLVGNETNDDAGVYKLRADLAIVTTVDFFPPVVDDPFVFGQIAAANALSDVYAMGAKPITALNVVGFPSDKLPSEVLTAILSGGAERAREAGVAVAGGHTVIDRELKYGMSVTGQVHPKRIVRNRGARKNQALVLTKAIGTGILSTAIKRRAEDEHELRDAITSMIALNDEAGARLYTHKASACTDVTGFGLAGHAAEMAAASTNVRLVFDADAIVLLPGTARLAEAGYVTGGAKRNRIHLGRRLKIGRDVADSMTEAVLDPQTSGGLLVSLPVREAPDYVAKLRKRGVRAAVIGRVEARPEKSPVLVTVE